MQSWKILAQFFTPEMRDALMQQHHAVQFLTMTAKAFISEKQDDSHTNGEYNSMHNAILGHVIEGSHPMRVGIRLTDLRLIIVSPENHLIDDLILDGKSKEEVFSELQKLFNSHGLTGDKLSMKLHYDLPQQRIGNGGVFKVRNVSAFAEINKQRHNANLMLTKVASHYRDVSDIRIWPHHFDSGGLISLAYDAQQNVLRSIGIGFAIPDTLVNEPYFYLSFWTADSTKELENPPAFSGKGMWKTPDWKGAVLPILDLLEFPDSKSQWEEVRKFFEDGIKTLVQVT